MEHGIGFAVEFDAESAGQHSDADAVFRGGSSKAETDVNRDASLQYDVGAGRSGHWVRCSNVECVAGPSELVASIPVR